MFPVISLNSFAFLKQTCFAPQNLEKDVFADFVCTLDCQDLDFVKVQEVILDDDDKIDPDLICSNFDVRKRRDVMLEWFDKRRSDFKFEVDKWSIKISKDGVKESTNFPRAIYLQYRTKPSGQSLLWRKNQVSQYLSSLLIPFQLFNNYNIIALFVRFD